MPLAAMCTCTAMMRFFHPQMIAQCANKPGPSLDQMIDFVLAGLAPRARRNAFRETRIARHCERSEAIQAPTEQDWIASSQVAPRNDGIQHGKMPSGRISRKTCTITSRSTATASSTIRSTPSSRRGRSAGSRRGTPRAMSIWRPTASSTASITPRRSSGFPRPPGRTPSATSRRPASSSGISPPGTWQNR